MKIAVVAEHPIERVAMALGLVPVTLADTHMAFLRARSIMVATKLGIFEALERGPLSAEAIASACRTSVVGTEKLLGALAGSHYLGFERGVFSLAPLARRWLLASSPNSLRDKVLFEFDEWKMIERIEEYVRSGEPLDMHGRLTPKSWELYQRAMRALSGVAAPEIVRRTPMPNGATAMLDVGGSHGFISVAMCRKHAKLRAVVLDLPAAIDHAAPLLAREGMGDRVTHRAGDAVTDDLGTGEWDLIYVSQLLHHFDAGTCRDFARRAARALRPNGVFAVLELIRPASPAATGQVGALLDLYFALTSQSGTWSVEEIAAWQREAGLTPMRPVRLRTVPGVVEVVARKT